MNNEDRLTGWLRQKAARKGQDLIGDDAAFIVDNKLAITADQQIEGVHFVPGLPAATVGRRLVAVNVSDIAAVGGLPTLGLATIAAPSGYAIREFLSSVEAELSEQGAQLAGGDIATAPAVHATLTLVGSRSPRGRWVRRSAARPGDLVWVGGTLGESAVGRLLLAEDVGLRRGRIVIPKRLTRSRRAAQAARAAVNRHLRPPNQIALGSWLSRRRRAAAIDISDGFLLDLERLCRASRVGALVNADRLPISEDARSAARVVGADIADLALSGGEDYVLLFALPAAVKPPASLGATCVGEIRRRRRLQIRGGQLPARLGWDHLTAD